MLKKLLCVILMPLTYCYNFDLCVVGATSGLGKELIYRSINEKNANVLAFPLLLTVLFMNLFEDMVLMNAQLMNLKITILS